MTDDPINRIEAALEAGPTPGPWHHEEWGSRILDSGVGSSQLLIAQVAVNSFRDQGRHNARFITACNPVAIRALLDRLKAAEADRRAEYWKAEHLAGNTEIERLSAEIERLRAEREQAWNAALDAAEKACKPIHANTLSLHADNSVAKCIDAIRALKEGA